MKWKTLLLIVVATLPVGAASADTVLEEVPDTLPGKSFGTLSGFMVGATAGPLGAIVGAGIGLLGGELLQTATGLNGRAYRIARDDGSQVVIRSPGQTWSEGDKVEIVRNRLVAKSMTAQR